jgi:hypothetical protein
LNTVRIGGGEVFNSVWSCSAALPTTSTDWVLLTATANFPKRCGHQLLVYKQKLILIGKQTKTYKNKP